MGTIWAGVRSMLPRSEGRAMDPTPDNIAYLYDGSVEGLFTAVFLTYANKEHPLDICPSEHYQPRIGQTTRQIETDFSLALRVQKGVSPSARGITLRTSSRLLLLPMIPTLESRSIASSVTAWIRKTLISSNRTKKESAVFNRDSRVLDADLLC